MALIMVDRLTRILWREFATEGTFEEDRHDDVRAYRFVAREVLRALEEPTSTMLEAGFRAARVEMGSSAMVAKHVWRDMIAAALAETTDA